MGSIPTGCIMKTYELFQGEQLNIADKILRRRLQILVHSCIYYVLNKNIISDKQWDTWARELVQLQNDYPSISTAVEWYDEFKDFDASTGAFLPIRNSWVMNKANWLLKNMCNNMIVAQKKEDTKTMVTQKTSTGGKKRRLF